MARPQTQLSAAMPGEYSYIVRTTRTATAEEREKALQYVGFNVFNFPSSLLCADFLSDAGCSAATDVQFEGLARGDEAYGRNHGYFAVLDAVRDIFERGTVSPGALTRRILVNEPNATFAPTDEDLQRPHEGGFANGGAAQLERPNCFIVPQQRCAEFLLFNGVRKAIEASSRPKEQQLFVVSNGLFDTTESHARSCGFVPCNLPDTKIPSVQWGPAVSPRSKNNFQGNLDVAAFKAFVQEKGADAVLFVVMTLTNARQAGHPVSMANLRETAEFAHAHGIPVVFDAARFAFNALAIHRFDPEYRTKPIAAIIAEMFSHCDAFCVGSKNASNSGGLLAFRDKGHFHKKFSSPKHDIGTICKEMQILSFGNDSYGGLSGRDLMAMAVGLAQLVDPMRLEADADQAIHCAELLVRAGVPGVSVDGPAVHIDVDEFFDGKSPAEDLRGVGLACELIRLYGVRIAELGPLVFGRSDREHTPNLVRISLPHGAFSEDHLQFTVAAIAELYRERKHIPRMKFTFGENASLRQFVAGLEPIYPADGKLAG